MMSPSTDEDGDNNNDDTIQPETCFHSTSSRALKVLHVSFAENPSASLGVQLVNCDTVERETKSMFLPGYAVIDRVLEGGEDTTVAQQAGVQVGDIIVAVNGAGFRRFAVDETTKEDIYNDTNTKVEIQMDHAVVPADGNAYHNMLAKLKAVKAANGDPPLILTLERHGWDSQANAWGRFLTARDQQVPAAMMMFQQHQAWREATFPISLKSPGLQEILKTKAVSEIDLVIPNQPPTVYVEYAKLIELQSAGTITARDVVHAFCIFTERLLASCKDPRHPSTCQLIDLSGVSITSGFRVDTLKQIYNAFEPNYPETLSKMVIYPVSTLMATTAKAMLSFVNENTKNKFLITNNLAKVCEALGWDQTNVEASGGVTQYMKQHETNVATTLLLETY